MSTSAFRPTGHRVSVGLCLAAAIGLLSACGGTSSTGQDPVVTVTVTPTVTTGDPSAPASATATTQAGVPMSDVAGRMFDLGTIVRVEEGDTVPVIIFDRWTAAGVADTALAADGVPIGVHSDVRYQNLNTKITYRIPVRQGAVFTYNHCVAVDQPAQQRSSTLHELAGLQGSERVLLVTLDSQGQVVSAQNDPAC